MKYFSILFLVLLAGCSSFSKTEADFACPLTGFIRNADVVSYFNQDSKLLLHAEMVGFQGHCSLDRKGNVVVEVKLPISVSKSAAGGELKKRLLPYFVALVSPEEEIIQRQSYSAKLDLAGVDTLSIIEENTIVIPLSSKPQTGRYKLLIGFQMTPEQLKYNQTQDQQGKAK